VRVAPGDRIPEPDASFDFVFSNSVLEHIDDLEPVITEVARVLRAGGTFLFTVPSAGFHDCLGGPLLPWVGRSAYAAQIDRRCAHIRYWSKPDWEGCMQRHGLGLTHASEYLTAPEVRRWETLARFTSGLLYPLFRSRLRPIEIQRRLGLRRSGVRLPPCLAAVLARRGESERGHAPVLLGGRHGHVDPASKTDWLSIGMPASMTTRQRSAP